MDKYEIPAIFFWPVYWKQVNQAKGRSFLSEEQADQIAKRFTIGSHTLTHPLLPEIDLDQAKDEIFLSRKLLMKRFNQPIESFCYPRGRNNQEVQDLVEGAGYRMARGTQVGSIEPVVETFNAKTSVHIGYPRKEYGNLHWLDYARKLLKQAKKKAEKGQFASFHIWGHGEEISRYKAWSDLEKLLKEMNA